MQCRQNSNIEILKLDFSVKVNMKSFSKIKRTFVKPKFSWFRAAILPIFLTLIIRMNLETTIFYAVNLTRKIDMSFLFMSATDNYILKKWENQLFKT